MDTEKFKAAMVMEEQSEKACKRKVDVGSCQEVHQELENCVETQLVKHKPLIPPPHSDEAHCKHKSLCPQAITQ
jgi:hypothetical protein